MKKQFIFGIGSNTIGQNVIRAIERDEQTIGIPPYDYGKMLKIMSEALKPDELDLMRRGFGIGCKRKSQRVIADELGITPGEVHQKAKLAIEKLQDSPYRAQLRKLVPTVQQIWARDKAQRETIKQLREAGKEVNPKELIRAKNLLETTFERLAEQEKSYKDLEKEKNQLQYRYETREREIKDLEEKLNNCQAINLELTLKANSAKEAFDKALTELDKGLEAAKENAKLTFAASLKNAKTSVNALEDLHLTKEEMEALGRFNCTGIEQLCSMDFRALTSMVGKKYASSIEAKLHAVGLALRSA